MPSITRSRAHTLRCPSPVHGERARSRQMAASSSTSPRAGFGPGRPAGLRGGRPSWRRASENEDRATPQVAQTHAPGRPDPAHAVGPAGCRRGRGGHQRDRLRAKRAGRLQPRPQQLVRHAQRADAAMRLGQLALLRIVITLPQPRIDPGEPALPPLLQLPYRHREPTGQAFDGLALHQAQHHLPLARRAPPLAGRQCCDRPVILGGGQRRRLSLASLPTAPSVPAIFSSIKLLLAVPVSTMSCPQKPGAAHDRGHGHRDRGREPELRRIFRAIEAAGAVVHSIDQVVAGRRIIERV
jgi:hypothetical protein